MTTTQAPRVAARPVLRRKMPPWPERRARFVSWRDEPLATLLGRAAETGTRTLYLMGGEKARTTPARGYWFDAVERGWELTNYSVEPRSARYQLGGGGARVDVHMAGTWFPGLEDAALAMTAYNWLRAKLRFRFDSGATLMGTPARTGLDLLQRSLPREAEYPTLPRDVLLPLSAAMHQGRSHPGPVRGSHAERALWLDGRWMYAHCLRNLPRGEARYDTRAHEFDKWAPAFYGVSFRRPRGWPYPFGLLPEVGDERSTWPNDDAMHSGWCTGAELQLAVQEGWRVWVQESITFAGGMPDPARTWIDKLRDLRRDAQNVAIADAIRNIVIHAVGGLAARQRYEQHSVPPHLADTIPVDAINLELAPGRVDYEVAAPLHKDLAAFAHPEWPAMVWGRARAHLARQALRYCRDVPNGRILYWRNDALVVDTDPGWLDDLAIGTFRVKRTIEGPLRIPTDEEEYRELLRSREG